MCRAADDRLRQLNDPALRPLIDASDPESREVVIEALITSTAIPLIDAVLKRFQRTEPNVHAEDVQELCSGVVVRLIRKLRAAASYEDHAIATLYSYISTLAHNACHDFRRLRHPERYRLKRNLRYLLSHHGGFALWEGADRLIAGLAAWRGSSPLALIEPPTRSSASATMRDASRPREALRAILERIGHPVLFDCLVDLVAEIWEVRDMVVESAELAPDHRGDQLGALEQQQYLEMLWRQILELPGNQRAALLLNLRDSAGSNALGLFLLLNIADVPEIARVVGLSENELNGLWPDLPLDDLTIAARLGLTRQQVINLRKSARLRLARRMGKQK